MGDEADVGDDTDTDTSTTGESDDWDELIEPMAGSRLRPMFRVADDGTRVQIGWQDTLFDTPCAFRETSSAGLRCVPSTGGNQVWLYADANCSEPVLQDIWIPEGATVVSAYGESCFDRSYYEVGEPVSEIFYKENGPCEFFSNDASHRVTGIAHDQFVSATLTPQAGTSRVVPLMLEADDGSRQIFGAWDQEHGEQVTAVPDGGEQLRWFGSREPRVSGSFYSDADCTQPAALAGCVPSYEEPTTAREVEPGYCGALIGRHQLLGKVTDVYVMEGGDCQPGELSGSSQAWRVGEALDDAAFAESSAVDGGGGRLRHDIYANPEGEPFLASGRVYDQELTDAECRWRDPIHYGNEPALGASFDCVPVDSAGLSTRYADADCTQRTASRWKFEESCLGPALYAYSSSEGTATAVSGPAAGEGGFGFDEENTCVPLPPTEPGGGGGEAEYFVLADGTTEVAHAVDVVE